MTVITTQAVAIYLKYQGDLDGFTRIGTKTEKSVISDDQWLKIEEIRTQTFLLKQGFLSQEAEQKLHQMAKSLFADENAFKEIYRIA